MKNYQKNNAPCSGILRDAAKTHEGRYAIYGENYKKHGEVMLALFPSGIRANTPGEHNRLHLIEQLVSKLSRYCMNIHVGGHKDSAHDMIVYAAMLEELTEEV
jgi:hypothetical protein